MAYQRKDSYYRKAKEEGLRSRASYKLQELDQRFSLFRKGGRVLDLGCAPGGWLQVAARAVGPAGLVVGMDLLPMQELPLAQVRFLQGDLTDPGSLAELSKALGGGAEVLMSDMAPNTSGVGFQDHVNSVALVRTALAVAVHLLKPGGKFLAKVFDGPEVEELARELKAAFGKLKRVRPDATRKGSKELYLVAENFRGGPLK